MARTLAIFSRLLRFLDYLASPQQTHALVHLILPLLANAPSAALCFATRLFKATDEATDASSQRRRTRSDLQELEVDWAAFPPSYETFYSYRSGEERWDGEQVGIQLIPILLSITNSTYTSLGPFYRGIA